LEKKSFQNYSKYSGMAFQLLGAILFGTFIGQWIDNKMQNTTQIATAICSLLGVIVGTYLAIKDLIRNDKNKQS
jgi:F0F1-type ATP synthase assembly protein I